jgi:hypothetical protein
MFILDDDTCKKIEFTVSGKDIWFELDVDARTFQKFQSAYSAMDAAYLDAIGFKPKEDQDVLNTLLEALNSVEPAKRVEIEEDRKWRARTMVANLIISECKESNLEVQKKDGTVLTCTEMDKKAKEFILLKHTVLGGLICDLFHASLVDLVKKDFSSSEE